MYSCGPPSEVITFGVNQFGVIGGAFARADTSGDGGDLGAFAP